MRAIPIVLLALFSLPLLGQSLDDFERVLVPALAYPPVTGANGSRFTGFVTLYAPAGTRFFPNYRADGSLTPEIGTFERTITTTLFYRTPPSRVGRLLFVERSRAAEIAWNATLASRASGETVDHRVHLPIVREQDFRSAPFAIVGVASIYRYEGESFCPAASPVYRHALRVYDPDGRGGAVRVRLVDEFGNGFLLRETTLELTSREGNDPSFPLYAEMEMAEVCHPFSCHTPCAGGTQRVEITPLTPSLRVWAMVSQTNNVTQEITLLYPE